MKPAAFAYRRATDVAEAVDHLGRLGADAKILAGGQSLVPLMNFRLARPAALVDVNPVLGLAYLRRESDGLHVGSLTRHRAVELCRDPEVLAGWSVLAASARWVGHTPIRTRGTFGGSLAHADPTSEWCMLALLLDAAVVAEGPGGRRSIPASQFFLGYFTTALAADEMLVEVVFPRPARHAALTEFAQRQGDFAIVAASVSLDLDGTLCTGARVVLGGVDSTPVRLPAAEAVLTGEPMGEAVFEEAGQVAAGEISPAEDLHGSAEYRRRLARTLLVRALREACSQGRGPADA